MRHKLILTALLAVAGASLLVASAMASGSTKTAKGAKGGTLTVLHLSSDFEYIDPQKCYDTGCGEVVWPISYNLMQYSEKNGADPSQKAIAREAEMALSRIGEIAGAPFLVSLIPTTISARLISARTRIPQAT